MLMQTSHPSLPIRSRTPGKRTANVLQQQQRLAVALPGGSRVQCHATALCYIQNVQMPMELARKALTATLESSPTQLSTSIIQGAPNGATVWFTTVCALSVALAALSYNLFSILAQLQMFQASAKQEQHVLHGVDVTNSRFFRDDRVLAAVEFAAQAHAGQMRKTGEPYVSHCMETALIVEHNLPPAAEHERYVLAIIAALLHDVIDDTAVDLTTVKAKFGQQVASMVAQVSKLSQMNQLLRRGKRKGWAEYSPTHFKALRKMIVDMVFEEPLVILIKLADRLHNMRTVFVLKPDKQRAVAEETLEVWCTMAECLGWDAMKSEMEDLCFAVLKPTEYCTLRAQLDRIWSLPSLKVVVEEADSKSLPANALAPAPVLSSRSRRAAAATAARKAAAAAAKSSAEASNAPSLAHADASRHAPDALAHGSGGTTIGSHDITNGPMGSQAVSARSSGTAVSTAQTAGQTLDLGFKIVASHPGLDSTELLDNAMLSSVDMAATSSTDWDGGRYSLLSPQGNTNLLTSTDQLASNTAPKDPIQDITAASVALLVSADPQTLQTVFPTLQHPTAQPGTSPDSEQASFPSKADMQLLQEHMQRLQSHASSSSGDDGGQRSLSSDSATMTGIHATARGETSVRMSGSSGASASPSGSSSGWRGGGNPSFAMSSVASSSSSTAAVATSVATLTLEAPSVATTATAVPTTPIPAPARVETPVSVSGLKATNIHRPQPPFTTLLSAKELEEVLASTSTPADDMRPVLYTAEQLARPTLKAGKEAEEKSKHSSKCGSSPGAKPLSEQQERLRHLLTTVVPFDSVNFKDTRTLAMSTRRGLEVLDECAELLYSEVMLRSAGGGLGLTIQGRLKSLFSVYRKMVRKGCSVAEVYDARALRVIVGDDNGSRARDAIETCYKLVSAVHSIWKPIPKEFDDYIANPKPSGYQALHTAVKGPGGIPMEVQIKTASMHELAEYGAAAHWVYKEFMSGNMPLPFMAMQPATTLNQPPVHQAVRHSQTVNVHNRWSDNSVTSSSVTGAGVATVAPVTSMDLQQTESHSVVAVDVPPLILPQRQKGRGWDGQPVLRIAKDKLRYGVVVSAEDEGKRLLVAVRAGATLPHYPCRVPEYAFYRSMVEYVQAKGWTVPGHSDFNVRLEEFVLSSDGRFHRKDHMGYLLPAEVLTLLEGYEEEADAAVRQAHMHAIQKAIQQAKDAVLQQAASSSTAEGTSKSQTIALVAANSKVKQELLVSQQGHVTVVPVTVTSSSNDTANTTMADASVQSMQDAVHSISIQSTQQNETASSPAATMPQSTFAKIMNRIFSKPGDQALHASTQQQQQQQTAQSRPVSHPISNLGQLVQQQGITQTDTTNSEPSSGHGSMNSNSEDPDSERLRRQMLQAYLRTQQLRTMIEWGRSAMGRYHQGGAEPGDEVSVLVWPGGEIEHWPRGTTVAQLVRAKGIITINPLPEPRDIRPSATAVAGGDDGWLSTMSMADNTDLDPRSRIPRININNRLVPEDTVLNDGDLVILTREKVKI